MRTQRAGAWQDWGSVVSRVGTEGEDEKVSLEKGDPGRRNHLCKGPGAGPARDAGRRARKPVIGDEEG